MKPSDWTKITTSGLCPNDSDIVGHGPPAEAEVELCREWIRKFAFKTKSVRHVSSYSFRQKVDEWNLAFDVSNVPSVSNGAFVEAARLEGYRILRLTPGSVNARFNMSLSGKRTKASPKPAQVKSVAELRLKENALRVDGIIFRMRGLMTELNALKIELEDVR